MQGPIHEIDDSLDFGRSVLFRVYPDRIVRERKGKQAEWLFSALLGCRVSFCQAMDTKAWLPWRIEGWNSTLLGIVNSNAWIVSRNKHNVEQFDNAWRYITNRICELNAGAKRILTEGILCDARGNQTLTPTELRVGKGAVPIVGRERLVMTTAQGNLQSVFTRLVDASGNLHKVDVPFVFANWNWLILDVMERIPAVAGKPA